MQSWDATKDAALKEAWGVYRTWAKTSRTNALQLRRSRWSVLILAISGSALSTAGQFVHSSAIATDKISLVHRALGSLGAIALALGTYLTRELVTEEAQRKWLRSRAIAEGAKSECFLFRLGVSPYDGPDSTQKLLDVLILQRRLVAGLTHDVMSNAEYVERLPIGPLTIRDYVRSRVEDQIAWYDKAIASNIRSIGRSRTITVVLGGVSVVLSIVALNNAGAEFVPLVASLTVALASSVAAAQYGYLIASYQATGDQLRALKQEWSLSDHPECDDAIFQFAKGCERAMASENSAWMAKLSENLLQAQRARISETATHVIDHAAQNGPD